MADAEATLRELIHTIAVELAYPADHHVTIKPVAGDGRNYTTNVHLITLKAQGKDDLRLFAKVACIGEKIRAVMNATTLYQTEAFVYTKLAKVYHALQDQADIPQDQRFVFPKFYGCNQELYKETMVFEDLVARGYECQDRFQSVDWEHAASAVVALARFHALSFAYQKRHPEDFDQVAKKYVFVSPEMTEATLKAWEGMMQRALGAVKEEHRGRMVKYLEKAKDLNLYERFNSPIGRAVLTHSDFRTCNMMFKREGSKIHTVPVDYQTLRSGSPTNDLVYFVAMATDAQFRRLHYERLVQLYYATLAARMAELGVDATEVYPRETFDSELEQMLPYALLVGIAVLPMVLVDVSEVPRLDGDNDLDSFATAASSDGYARRMDGLVEDLVRWGAI